jgi:NADPH-dependent 2,4-dienoyl-CoA reductase/sulfur reductase-like enzyme
MRLPLGKNLQWAGVIKNEVDLPVIAAGRLGDPADIRHAIDNQLVDAVALGRPLIADPDLPNKMKEGRDEQVLQCGACLQGCLVKVKAGEGLACIVNPEVGHEAEKIRNSRAKLKIVVVGGGPGGMQAALTARQRGHEVVLFDEHELGGQFNLSYLPPGKEMMKRPLDSMIRRVRSASIELRTNRKASPQDILTENPDTVILATGAVPIIPSIPGLEVPITGKEILTGRKEAGQRVLIVGGGMVGLETAEFLAKKGHVVTVVELLAEVARDMMPLTRTLTVKELERLGVRILTKTTLTRCDGNKAYIQNGDGEEELGEFDSVIVAAGTRSVNHLEAALSDKNVPVIVIGDARKPRQIFDAVTEGFRAALEA